MKQIERNQERESRGERENINPRNLTFEIRFLKKNIENRGENLSTKYFVNSFQNPNTSFQIKKPYQISSTIDKNRPIPSSRNCRTLNTRKMLNVYRWENCSYTKKQELEWL